MWHSLNNRAIKNNQERAMSGCAKRCAYFVANVVDESKVLCSLCPADIPRSRNDIKSFNISNMPPTWN